MAFMHLKSLLVLICRKFVNQPQAGYSEDIGFLRLSN
jgi:hypothetical protein